MARQTDDLAERVKRLAIKAMFSDDELMDRLVLKGGNLLDVIYRITIRSSTDIDFSFDGDPWDVTFLKGRIERALKSTFAEIGYEVFDVNVAEKPPVLSAEVAAFWGGYQVDFKIIEQSLFRLHSNDIDQLRRHAAGVGQRGSTRFEIDISKHEYCESKRQVDFDGLAIYAYTPAMVVCEKLRAICQQMPEYGSVVKRSRSGTARARDFVDIHTIISRVSDALNKEVSETLLLKIFERKRVPISLLHKLRDHREFHRPDFASVSATVRQGFDLRDFDFYFDFVVDKVRELEPFWNK